MKKAVPWKPDAEASACASCSAVFTLFNRRHHCRKCGDVFCNECTSYRYALEAGAPPVRICRDCRRSTQLASARLLRKVAIIGSVGSGKSALANVIHGNAFEETTRRGGVQECSRDVMHNGQRCMLMILEMCPLSPAAAAALTTFPLSISPPPPPARVASPGSPLLSSDSIALAFGLTPYSTGSGGPGPSSGGWQSSRGRTQQQILLAAARDVRYARTNVSMGAGGEGGGDGDAHLGSPIGVRSGIGGGGGDGARTSAAHTSISVLRNRRAGGAGGYNSIRRPRGMSGTENPVTRATTVSGGVGVLLEAGGVAISAETFGEAGWPSVARPVGEGLLRGGMRGAVGGRNGELLGVLQSAPDRLPTRKVAEGTLFEAHNAGRAQWEGRPHADPSSLGEVGERTVVEPHPRAALGGDAFGREEVIAVAAPHHHHLWEKRNASLQAAGKGEEGGGASGGLCAASLPRQSASGAGSKSDVNLAAPRGGVVDGEGGGGSAVMEGGGGGGGASRSNPFTAPSPLNEAVSAPERDAHASFVSTTLSNVGRSAVGRSSMGADVTSVHSPSEAGVGEDVRTRGGPSMGQLDATAMGFDESAVADASHGGLHGSRSGFSCEVLESSPTASLDESALSDAGDVEGASTGSSSARPSRPASSQTGGGTPRGRLDQPTPSSLPEGAAPLCDRIAPNLSEPSAGGLSLSGASQAAAAGFCLAAPQTAPTSRPPHLGRVMDGASVSDASYESPSGRQTQPALRVPTTSPVRRPTGAPVPAASIGMGSWSSGAQIPPTQHAFHSRGESGQDSVPGALPLPHHKGSAPVSNPGPLLASASRSDVQYEPAPLQSNRQHQSSTTARVSAAAAASGAREAVFQAATERERRRPTLVMSSSALITPLYSSHGGWLASEAPLSDTAVPPTAAAVRVSSCDGADSRYTRQHPSAPAADVPSSTSALDSRSGPSGFMQPPPQPQSASGVRADAHVTASAWASWSYGPAGSAVSQDAGPCLSFGGPLVGAGAARGGPKAMCHGGSTGWTALDHCVETKGESSARRQPSRFVLPPNGGVGWAAMRVPTALSLAIAAVSPAGVGEGGGEGGRGGATAAPADSPSKPSGNAARAQTTAHTAVGPPTAVPYSDSVPPTAMSARAVLSSGLATLTSPNEYATARGGAAMNGPGDCLQSSMLSESAVVQFIQSAASSPAADALQRLSQLAMLPPRLTVGTHLYIITCVAGDAASLQQAVALLLLALSFVVSCPGPTAARTEGGPTSASAAAPAGHSPPYPTSGTGAATSPSKPSAGASPLQGDQPVPPAPRVHACVVLTKSDTYASSRSGAVSVREDESDSSSVLCCRYLFSVLDLAVFSLLSSFFHFRLTKRHSVRWPMPLRCRSLSPPPEPRTASTGCSMSSSRPFPLHVDLNIYIPLMLT